MQSILLTPDNHSPEEVNELFKSVFSDLNKDVSKIVLRKTKDVQLFIFTIDQKDARDAFHGNSRHQSSSTPLDLVSQDIGCAIHER